MVDPTWIIPYFITNWKQFLLKKRLLLVKIPFEYLPQKIVSETNINLPGIRDSADKTKE